MKNIIPSNWMQNALKIVKKSTHDGKSVFCGNPTSGWTYIFSVLHVIPHQMCHMQCHWRPVRLYMLWGVPRPMHQVTLRVACKSRPPRVKERYLRSREQKRHIRSFMKGCGVRWASVAAVVSRCEDMLRDAEGRSVRIRRCAIFGKSLLTRYGGCEHALGVISYERPLPHHSYVFQWAHFRFFIFPARGAPPKIPNIDNFRFWRFGWYVPVGTPWGPDAQVHITRRRKMIKIKISDFYLRVSGTHQYTQWAACDVILRSDASGIIFRRCRFWPPPQAPAKPFWTCQPRSNDHPSHILQSIDITRRWQMIKIKNQLPIMCWIFNKF